MTIAPTDPAVAVESRSTLSRPVTHTVQSLRRLADAEKWRSAIRTCYGKTARRAARAPIPYYKRCLIRRLRHVVHPGATVLDVGCGFGDLLSALKPSRSLGVDLVPEHVEQARRRHPGLRFECRAGEHLGDIHETFDFILLSECISEIYDVSALLTALLQLCHDRTRLIIVQDSRVWQPAIRLAEWVRLKRTPPRQNWLPVDEIRNLLSLSGWEQIRQRGVTLCPLPVPGVSWFVNRYVANLPLIERLCLNHVLVARPIATEILEPRSMSSVSVVVPARNEAGHIRSLLERLPNLAESQEVVFVEGNSTDDTWQVIQNVVNEYRGPWTLRAIQQDGAGKGDAVRKAFATCTGDVLMILDADLSVPPEELVMFRDAIAGGRAEFVNGSRMVYAMDKEAMRFLNLLGNRFFSGVFTWLLGIRFRDTLCGTKVLRRSDYERIAAGRSYFGDFDPFGDFDLLFGAARQNLKIVDVPVHYKARTYGATNISRFRHGLLLLRMCAFAARKLWFI